MDEPSQTMIAIARGSDVTHAIRISVGSPPTYSREKRDSFAKDMLAKPS